MDRCPLGNMLYGKMNYAFKKSDYALIEIAYAWVCFEFALNLLWNCFQLSAFRWDWGLQAQKMENQREKMQFLKKEQKIGGFLKKTAKYENIP